MNQIFKNIKRNYNTPKCQRDAMLTKYRIKKYLQKYELKIPQDLHPHHKTPTYVVEKPVESSIPRPHHKIIQNLYKMV